MGGRGVEGILWRLGEMVCVEGEGVWISHVPPGIMCRS